MCLFSWVITSYFGLLGFFEHALGAQIDLITQLKDLTLKLLETKNGMNMKPLD